MTDSSKNVEEVDEAKVDSADEVETAKDDDAVRKAATEESDVEASTERRNENIIERGGKVAYASDVLKPGKGETDINPLDGNKIDKDSQFNPTKGI